MASEQMINGQTSSALFMSRFPRFGYGSDFSKLVSSKREEQTDYVVGILAVSFFIISLFIFWAAVIVTCKCMGKRRVGLFAGRMRVECDENGRFNKPSYAWKLRFTCIMLGGWIILFCLALVGPGLASVKSTSISIRKLNRDINDLTTQGMLILDSVERVKWNLDKLDVQSIMMVEAACPNLANNTFISDESLNSTIKALNKEFNQLTAQLQYVDLEEIRKHIDYILDGTDHVEIAVTTFEENDWIVRMFALVIIGLTVFMILAACSLCSGICIYRYLAALTCMLQIFILPTFVLAIICCWIATSALAFASIFNSDFCSGNSLQSGPAGTLINIFEERGIASNDLIYTAFAYYQSDCTTVDPIIQLYQYEDYLRNGIDSADKFLAEVNGVGIDKINDQCGADVSPIIEGVGIINDSLGVLLDALRSTYEMASCSRMRSIYTQVFDGIACAHSSGSLVLLFLIMFAISLTGMVLIMLRSSMYPFKRVFPFSSFDEDENKLDEYPACLQYVSSSRDKWDDSDGPYPSNPDPFETSSVSTSVSNSRETMNLGVALSLSNNNSNDDVGSAPNTEDERNSPLSSTFPDKWGHNYGASPSKPDTFETSSASISDSNTSTSVNLDVTPGFQSIYNATDEAESAPNNIEDERNAPLSSPDSKLFIDQSLTCTPDSMPPSNGEGYVDFTPMSPQTPNYHSGMRNRRFAKPEFLTPGTSRRWRRHDEEEAQGGDEIQATPLMISPQTMTNDSETRSRRFATPEFLTPGTFRRWRRRDEEDARAGDDIPETPLMISPNDHGRVSYFSEYLSPLRPGFHQYNTTDDKSK